MKVAMFVYGSLRPGQYNALRTGVQEVFARNVTIRGRMRSVGSYGGYPLVYVGGDDAYDIVGDILLLEADSDTFQHIVQMEVGAGYVPVSYPVGVEEGNLINPDDDCDEELWCMVWHYPDFDRGRGPIVESGDWVQWEAGVTNGEDEDDEEEFFDIDDEDEENDEPKSTCPGGLLDEFLQAERLIGYE